MKRRNILLLFGGAGASSMTVGTGAFSSVSADREVVVNVVEDGQAYFSLEEPGENVTVVSGNPGLFVTVKNQFPEALSFEASTYGAAVTLHAGESSDGGGVTTDEDDRVEAQLDPGAWVNLAVETECDENGETDFEVNYEGTAGGTSVDKTREYTVECVPRDVAYTDPEPDDVDEVDFRGKGQVRITWSSAGSKTVTVRYADETVEELDIDVDAEGDSTKIKRNGGDGTVCWIEVAGIRFDNVGRC